MIEILNTGKKKPPVLPWEKIKKEILGEKHYVSLVFADNVLMKRLNKLRNKDTAANTLSFRLSENDGEIFLNINNTPDNLILLYIHSLLHLKGFKHGREMEEVQKKYFKKFIKHGS